jgi:hypothetical protein
MNCWASSLLSLGWGGSSVCHDCNKGGIDLIVEGKKGQLKINEYGLRSQLVWISANTMMDGWMDWKEWKGGGI